MKFNKILLLITFILVISLNSCKDEELVTNPVVKNGWDFIELGTNEDLYDVFFIDENEGWIIGEDNIFHTIDGGVNWDVIFTDKNLSGDKIYFLTSKIGWIAGGDGLYKTTDGGRTWVIVFQDNDDVDKIKFFDLNIGYLLFDCNFFITNNGGKNWRKEIFSKNYFVRSIGVVIDANNLLSFRNDTLLKSSDAGITWNHYKIQSGFNQIYNSMQFYDLNNGFYGSSSGIFKTTDGGINWIKIYAPLKDEKITNIHFINKSKGWAIITKDNFNIDVGKLLFTSDGGNTWTSQKSGLTERMNSMFFVNEKKGFAVGNNGTIIYTKTGGIELR